MCAPESSKNKKMYTSLLLYAAAILLGIFSGLSGIAALQNFGIVISDIFIKIFKFISLPIIALSIIVTLSGYSASSSMKKIWQRTILYTLGTTIIAAAISCLLYLLIHPANVNIAGQNLALPVVGQTGYWQYLSNLIPNNIFSPFVDHQVISVLLVGITLGIAIRYIPEHESRSIVINFFKGAHGIFIVITKWIAKIIPLGLYGFITATVVQLHSGLNIKGIGEYLSVVILANLIQGLVVLPIWLKFNGIQPFAALRGMLPALSVAFFSKSSAATLPLTMDTAEKNLRVDPKVSRFVLPLCTSINMNGCAAFIFTTVMYLMQNQGMHLSLPTMGLWILIATIAAVGNAGVPMGCFFLSASLLTSMNVPINLLGLIFPFYSIIDMLETSLNVWSDSCVSKVVNEKELASIVQPATELDLLPEESEV